MKPRTTPETIAYEALKAHEEGLLYGERFRLVRDDMADVAEVLYRRGRLMFWSGLLNALFMGAIGAITFIQFGELGGWWRILMGSLMLLFGVAHFGNGCWQLARVRGTRELVRRVHQESTAAAADAAQS